MEIVEEGHTNTSGMEILSTLHSKVHSTGILLQQQFRLESKGQKVRRKKTKKRDSGKRRRNIPWDQIGEPYSIWYSALMSMINERLQISSSFF